MIREASPEWKRGWHLVALTVLGLTCAPTVLPPYTIGIFVAALEGEFGWSRAAIQATIMFSTGLGLISGPLAGWLVRRFGARKAIVSGLMGMALALAYSATIEGRIWQLYLAYALMAVLGTGAGAVSWSYLIATNFVKSRGLALGIALSGTGLCAVLMPRITAESIGIWGWRGAYLALAGFVVLIVLPICFLLLPRHRSDKNPDQAQPSPSRTGLTMSEAVGDYRFWLIGTSSACIYMAVGGLIPNLVPILLDKGLAMADAVSIMSIFGFSVILGRIAIGALVDHFWAPAIAACVLVPAAAACTIFSIDTNPAVYTYAAIFVGAATGMEFDMLGFLVARYFGLADYARIYGRIFMFVAAAAGTAPFAYGALFDMTRNYELPLILSSILLCSGAAGLLALGSYPVLPESIINRRDAS